LTSAAASNKLFRSSLKSFQISLIDYLFFGSIIKNFLNKNSTSCEKSISRCSIGYLHYERYSVNNTNINTSKLHISVHDLLIISFEDISVAT
jgi:hypothetical protein